jgi:hypothetical protein
MAWHSALSRESDVVVDLDGSGGRVISRTMVQRVTNLELTTNKNKEQCKDYNQRVKDILSNTNHIIPQGDNIALQDWNNFPVEEDPEFIEEIQCVVS